MVHVKKTILVTFAPILLIAGCQSKFNDKAPDGSGAASGFTLENRMKANEELDRKLAKLEASADKVRKLIKQFRKIQQPTGGQDVYTHLDFMLDMNQQFKNSPVEAKDNKWVKYGKLKLNIKGLTPECAIVDTKVETLTSVMGEVQTDDLGQITDGLIYSIKTCKSKMFTQVVSVDITESRVSLSFNNENLRQSLEDTVLPAIREATKCAIETSQKDVLGRVDCANLSSKISATETLAIDSLIYDRSEDLRLLLKGRFMMGEVQKGTIYFAIGRDGKPDLRVEKTP